MTATIGNILWGITSAWAWTGVVALGVVCAGVSIWLYTRQRRALPRSWWALMLAFRIAAILAICLSLLEPTAVRTKKPAANTGIAILIDRSASMSAIDTGDPPAQRVAIAAALRLFPPQLRNQKFLTERGKVEALLPLLEETRRQLTEQQYARLTNSGSAPHNDDLAVRWRAATAQFGADPVTSSLPGLSHGIDQPEWADNAQKTLDSAVDNLAAAQRTADEKLYEKNADVRAACAKLAAMTRLDRAGAALASLVAQTPSSTPIYAATFDSSFTPISLREHAEFVWPDIKATGTQSDISGALQQLYARIGDAPLRAIVLFTDGRQVGGALAARSENTIPIFPIQCAGIPRDLVLSSVTAAAHAYLHQPIDVEAQIRAINLSGIVAHVVLTAGEFTQIQAVHLDDDQPASLHFTLPLTRPGTQSVSVNVLPVPGEANRQNNRVDFHLAANATRMSVALLASFPNRDFQFLRQQLQDASWIDSKIVLPGDSISPETLEKESVIILNDLAPSQLTPAQWTAIRNAAEKNGAGLILIAGGNHLPSEYLSDKSLVALLPFDAISAQPVWRTWAGANAYFRFAPIDPHSSLLRLEDNSPDVTPQWNRLAAMYHYLQMPPLKPAAHALLLEQESASPVLTQMTLGNGRALLVGFNETWRWRRDNLQSQRRFWTNLLCHAAPLNIAPSRWTPPPELLNLTPEESLLARLASSSTDHVYSLTDCGDVWRRIREYERTHPVVSEYPLWHSFWLFGLILGCFGAEWALRKRFGLA